MPATVKVGSFAKDTGAAPVSQAMTGVGFRPTALILWSSGQTVDGYTDAVMETLGWTDGMRVGCRAIGVDDGTLNLNSGQSHSNAHLLRFVDGAPTVQAEATLTSLDADGFTITWTTNDATARIIHYLAIGGAAEAFCGNFIEGAGTSDPIAQSVTGVGFQPDLVLFFGGSPSPGAPVLDESRVGAEFSFGAMTATQQWAQASTYLDGANTSERIQLSTNCIVVYGDNVNSTKERAIFVSMDADGFSISWTGGTNGTTQQPFFFLALKNVSAALGASLQPTSNGAVSVTGLSFEPEAVLLTSMNAAASAAEGTPGRRSMGAGDGTTEGCIWRGVEHGGGLNYKTARSMVSTKVMRCASEAATGSSSTTNAEADLLSLDAGGFTLDWTTTDATARELLYLALYVPPDTEVDFGSLPQQSGEVIGLSWFELDHVDLNGAPKTYLMAPTDLNDPADYYGGYKGAPYVVGFGEITRGLSDKHGNYESPEWSLVVEDMTRTIRALLDSDRARHLVNRMGLIRMIDDAGRRLFKRPRVLVRGVVTDVKPRSPLHVEFVGGDFLASKFGAANLEKQIPQRLISRADFPDCPIETVKLPVPIIYGQLSDAGSANPPPTLTGTAALGSFTDGGVRIFGFGGLTSGAAVPTGLAVAEAAGGSLSIDVPDAKYGAFVTAVDSSGRETDPDCAYTNVASNGSRQTFPGNVQTVTLSASGKKIQASWSAAAGAAKYRVYLGYYYFGFRPLQWIEVTAPTTSCEFTAGAAWGVPPTPSNITPGASVFTWFQRHEYAVAAVYTGGETALSDVGHAWWYGSRRPFRVEWTAPTIAPLYYYIYRREMFGSWNRRWTVPVGTTTFDDDNLDTNVTYIEGVSQPSGAVPLIPVGTVQDVNGAVWNRFLLCGHAVKEITDLYQGGVRVDEGKYGVTFAVPGKTGYATYFANTGNPQYVDITGHRYTCVMVLGPDGLDAATGDRPLTANVKGKETAGDGTGTLIEALADIYLDLVTQWFFQSYETGAPLATPTWPVDVDGTVMTQVDTASFTALKALHQVRLAGGYTGAIMFGAAGESITLREALARLNLSCDCDAGFNRNSAYFVSALDDRTSVLATALAYTQVHDTVKRSFDMDPRQADVENIIVTSYRRRYAPTQGQRDWDVFEEELRDQDAINARREEKRSRVLDLHGVRSASIAYDIRQRRLTLLKEAPNVVTVLTNLKGLATELGDVILVTNFEGTGALGWTLRPVRVLRHVTHPGKYTVRLECVDLQRIYYPETSTASITPMSSGQEVDGLEAVLAAQAQARRRRAIELSELEAEAVL